jgi:penicillin-binding protein 1A
VLALLAFAALPALAQAEDSSGIQYETEKYESGAKPKHPNPGGQKEPQAEASTPNQPNSGGNGSESSETGTKHESEGKHAGAAGGNGNNGGNGPGSSGSSNGNSEAGLGESEALSGTQSGQQVSHSSGGSSPLVPILVAVAVLAAISIGAVIYRQRRQDGGGSGSPVSPKAG